MSRNAVVLEIRPLSARERALWHAIKKIASLTATLGAGEIVEGVTGADYAILSRLDELGGDRKALEQRTLGVSLGWERSRLSHQLTRMESRRLVRRVRSGRSATIELLKHGEATLQRARPGHASLIRGKLLTHLTAPEAQMILSLAEKLPLI